MKVLLLTDLFVYGLLLISSYFLVFRRSPRLAPARAVVGEVKRDPIGEVAHPRPAISPVDPPPFTLPESGPAAPWWASGVAVETSP